MTFEELKEYHLFQLKVVLKSGKVYEGIITSHHLSPENPAKIIGISLMGENYIVWVDAREIDYIQKLYKIPLNWLDEI